MYLADKPIRRESEGKRPVSEESFVDSPDYIKYEAEQIKNSAEELTYLLKEIPEDYLDSEGNIVTEFYITIIALNATLDKLLEKNQLNEINLDRARDLLYELRDLKNQLDTNLTESAEIDPATGPGDELAVLPKGEVVPDEPTPTIEDSPIGIINVDNATHQDGISTNLDPATEPARDIFNSPISAVPPEERVLMSDLETQQPRTPEEAEALKLLNLYREGSRDVFRINGKPKPLGQIRKEISQMFELVEHTKGRIGFLFSKEIDKITTEIVTLNKNLVLLPKEKSKRLDEAYGRLLAVAQKNLQGRNHRFVRSTSVVEDPGSANTTNNLKPAEDVPSIVIPAQHEDTKNVIGDIPDQTATQKGDTNTTVSFGAMPDPSIIPTLNDVVDKFPDFKEILADIDYNFILTQARFMEVTKVLSLLGLHNDKIGEKAIEIISDYEKINETDKKQAIQDKSECLESYTLLLESISLFKIKGINPNEFDRARILRLEGDQVAVERLGNMGIVVSSEQVSLAELKELNSPDGLAVNTIAEPTPIDKTVPFVNKAPVVAPATTDPNQDNTPVLPVVDTVGTAPVEVSPSADSNQVITPEASAIEAELTAEEAYVKEKEIFSSLRDSIYAKQLGLKFYYELDRAEIHLQTIDYIIKDSGYTKPVRERKIRQNTEALAKINARLAEGLKALEADSPAPTPEPEPATPGPIHTPEPIVPPEPEPSVPLTTPAPTTTSKTAPIPSPTPLPPLNATVGAIPTSVATEPLMDAHVDAYREATLRAERLKVAGLNAPRQLDTVPFMEREKMRGEYAKERTLAIESRKDFKTAETNYQTKLKEFYENRSIFSKAGGAIRTLFGGKPKLPPELEKLQTIFKYTKEQYATHLREAWEKRAGAFAGNKVLDEAKPTIKKAFAKKFVLEPRYRLLDVQAEAYEKSAQNSNFKPIMSFMRKHRTALRLIGFGIAAGTGAAAGSALIAGSNIARWGISTFGGAAAAADIYKRREKSINDAVANLSLEKEKIEKEFTLAKLNDFDESLAFSSLEVERAKLKQKVYAVGAAVAVGGAANVGTSLLSNAFTPEVVASGRVNGPVISENANEVSADEAVRLAHEKRIAEIQESVRKINEIVAKDNARIAAQKLGVSYQSPTSTASEVAINLEVTPETLLQMGAVKVPQYSPSGELLSEISVSNIRLQGTSTDALRGASLPDAKVLEIYSHLKYKVNDILAAHPNYSKIELEKLLFNELENIYGGEDWWNSAKINEVKIDSIVTDRPGARATVPGTAGMRADIVPEQSILSGEAITSGATLVADNLATKSEAVPLNVQPEPVLGREPITYTRSGDLAIDADAEVRRVPILNAVYNPTEQINAVNSSVEAVTSGEIYHPPLEQVAPSVVPPNPDLYVANGNYIESPDFKTYINSEYGSLVKFNKILLNQALAVEGETYDVFNKWLNEYQSPYEMSLAKMTIGDLKEAFGGPDLGSKGMEVDTTGLSKQYDTDAIRQYASDNNFNYETVRKWLITLEDLKQEFPHQNETTLEDLFARSIIKADLLAMESKGIRA